MPYGGGRGIGVSEIPDITVLISVHDLISGAELARSKAGKAAMKTFLGCYQCQKKENVAVGVH